ncbi:MAG: phage virion morphogenesis protein [Stutzerimonas stutzeri]|nr:MAG: phage virion morphogenesis protein [Stutzerimonas stutzeri]
MAEGVRLEVNDEAVTRQLDQVAGIEGAKREILDPFGGYLVTSTQRRFERETAPDGSPWQRLSPRTAARRIRGRRRGFENILRVTRRLEQSIVYKISGNELHVGSNVEYAAAHQLGAEIEVAERQQTIFQHYDAKTDTFDQRFRKPSRSNFARDVTISAHTISVPARAYLGLDDADRLEFGNIVTDFMGKRGLFE